MDDVELTGGPEYEEKLRRLAELIADLRPFWPRVVPLFIGWVGRQFETEGSFFGEPWEPLSEAYAAWKTTHYPDKGILSADGDLRRAATTPERRAFPGLLVLSINPYEHRETEHQAAREIDPDWFQSGTSRMPARPLLAEVLPEEADEELRIAAEAYITENARTLGLLAD